MQSAYLDYAMSVIVGRALPDARDGLKPVHRRVLFAMLEAGNAFNKPHKKSARIVGEVLGKFHPHGGEAVYDALVRMAQDFSLRYPLIDGQGNFGSVDGDNPAAMRYTEVRMSRIAHSLLEDIDKDTVDFIPNYDGSENEPVVLPSRIPNLLVNGASGIAVGMATNIPPHNIGETADACLLLLSHPEATPDMLMKKMPAPDFPTAGFIHGLEGARDAYRTGRGRIIMRARTHFEESERGRSRIIIDELPYQVNKATLLLRIADLVRDKKIEGISDLRDESDRNGMRVVIELRRGENEEVILNQLYKETQLQDSFSVNMVALVGGAPRLLNLRELLSCFLDHRREVIVRRTAFDLKKTRARAHLLEGLAVALANVDAMIEIIKKSPTPAAAKEKLLAQIWAADATKKFLAKLESPELTRPEDLDSSFGFSEDGYRLSPTQAQAILEMRLARLTGLEQEKIFKEYEAAIALIADLITVLENPEKVRGIIADELSDIKKQFGDKRRSEIVAVGGDIAIEDLITQEDLVVTLSHKGYIKTQPISDYRAQKRGGRGKQATATRDDDFIDKLVVANTHDYILCFTSRGRVFWMKVYELPRATRISRGRPVVNLLPLMDHEKIQATLAVREFDDNHFVIMATACGVVKKTALSAFSRPRPSGIIAIGLDENDDLINAEISEGGGSIMLFADGGKAIRFPEDKIRAIGRAGRGVRGMKLAKGQRIVSMLVVADEKTMILAATENGYGKRTPASAYSIKGRAGQGVAAIKVTARNGKVVGAIAADKDDEVMLITNGGILIRTTLSEIRKTGRSAAGVRLINPSDDQKLVGIARIVDDNGEDD